MKVLKALRILLSRVDTRFVCANIISGLVLVVAPTSLANAQCTRCCGVCCFTRPNLSIGPTTASQGETVKATMALRNCSPYPTVITAKLTVTPDSGCTSFAEAFSVEAYVPGTGGRIVTYSFPAPKCSATYQVKESSSNATGIVTRTLTVN